MQPLSFCKRGRHAVSGWTLVETITVSLILLALATVISVGSLAAKHRALVLTDIGNLRNLGTAAALYAQEHNDRWPLSVRQLVESGKVTDAVTSSKLDPTSGGIALTFVDSLALKGKEMLLPTVRTSYIGVGDGMWSYASFEAKILTQEHAGWLVNLARCDPGGDTSYKLARGPYQRLLLDGAVIGRVSGFKAAWSGEKLETGVIKFEDWFHD